MLDLYAAFRTAMEFRPEDVAPEFRRAEARVASRADAIDADTFVDPRDIGSNNWIISGSRTQSTFPIMANDPHRVQGAPSLRYWAHLVARAGT